MVIPAFAIERTQDLIVMLTRLRLRGEIPELPMFVDSPMAIQATRVFSHHPELLSPAIRAMGPGIFESGVLQFASTPAESRAINEVPGPRVIVASSGMAVGGRVLHHLERLLPHPENTVVLVGYQVAGTRGRLLAAGGSAVKMHGREVPVRAQVVQLEGLSAHADRTALVAWFRALGCPPQVVLVHGEPDSLSGLANALRDAAPATRVVIPALGQVLALDAGGVPSHA